LKESGLACFCMSSHIDLGRADAVDVFTGRMDFARAIGAAVIASNAAVRNNEGGFWRNIEPLARHAEKLGLVIGLENPGDQRPSLFDAANDGLKLIERIGSPYVRLNYDPGNTASHLPAGPDPADDAVVALDGCAHMHLKDVRRSADGWRFTSVGRGDVACGRVLAELAKRPALSFCIEMPLRIHRGRDAQPIRRPERVPLAEIESAVEVSLQVVDAALGDVGR
jgi:sugar phosphate isomerase/epimerase